MTEPALEESEPLFWAFGHAVYAAQLLERGVLLLLVVVESEKEKSGLPQTSVGLDDPKSHKTLGTLFNEVLEVEYITEAEKKIIWKAINNRNILVHSYWGKKQTLASLTAPGRKWLVSDLLRRKEQCRKADEIISSCIDRYLSKYGTSIDALSTPLFEQWQNDEEPPDEVLH